MRTAISRAYYAVYCLVRNYARDIEGSTFSGSVHLELQEHLKQSRDKRKAKVGNQLQRLHQLRKEVDYDDNLDQLPVNKASLALAQAQKIVTGLDALCPVRK